MFRCIDCATSIFEDGIQIPICKLYSRGLPNKAVFKVSILPLPFSLHTPNVFFPPTSRSLKETVEDLTSLGMTYMLLSLVRARPIPQGRPMTLALATKIASKRILELVERFGLDRYEEALDALLMRNRAAVGKLIKTTIPDEPIYFEDYVDDDGHGVGPWKVAWYVPVFKLNPPLIVATAVRWKNRLTLTGSRPSYSTLMEPIHNQTGPSILLSRMKCSECS